MLTDGRCFFVGATGKTALYSAPPVASDVGRWVNGPDFPNTDKTQLGAKDAPACLLPNGRVLCTVGPVDGKEESYLTPTSFFEFDGQQLNRVPDPPNNGGAPFDGRLLIIPSGQALYSAGSPEIYAYTPDSGPQDAWRPSIVDCPDSVSAGSFFTLSGRQLNGLSQASMYGDDASAATNYPLVRITTASGRIVFCTTSNHSTMAIATRAQLVTTSVAVPADIENGLAQLIVVANGVASDPREVLITGGRAAAGGRSKFSPVASHPMAESRHATASRGILGAIGLGIRYIPCGLYYACNWAAQLTCTESETSAYAQCAKTEAQGYSQCTATQDNGYNECSETRDEGYSQCSQTRDDGYNQCCTWAPCSWFCDAWVWVSNIVCVAWTWVSNIVCVAWTWISNIVCVAWTWLVHTVCVAWTWFVATVCRAFVWVMKRVCP